MSRIKNASGLALLALCAVLGTASAEPWDDYSSAFPAFPCQDGWMGCVAEGGQRLEPELQPDGTGMLNPANARIGWFDLQATSNFSPFPELSRYTGEEPKRRGGSDASVDADPDGGDPAAGGDDGSADADVYVDPEIAVAAQQAQREAQEKRLQEKEASRAADEAKAEEERARREEQARMKAAQEKAEAARRALEQAKKAQSAQEKERLQREARAAQEAERLAKEQAAEAARLRKQREEEAARRAKEEEAARQAAARAEADRKKAEEEKRAAAEQARKEEEARRQAAEAEAARKADEARKKAEAEAKAEAARLAAAAAAAASAAEKAKIEEEARQKAAAAKAEADAAAQKAREEEEKKAREAEAARKAEQAAAQREAMEKMEAENTSAAAATGGGDGCDDLVGLETVAILGKLDAGTVQCLEGRLASESKMTTKSKISRTLMINAFAGGKTKEWAALMKRHLNEIEQSDPELCYKYALHLSKKGPVSAYGVIKWANVALENRMIWTGATYTSRVYSLYKIRATAAEKIWIDLEDKHASSPTEESSQKAKSARDRTKEFAREWYEYAKVAGKPTEKALDLCMSSAGTKDYCEAG